MSAKPAPARIRPHAWLSHLLIGLGLMLSALALAAPASAVPSFARQTGQPCSACHVGNFGPQLTPFGRQFKLQGYGATVSWDAGLQKNQVPFSMMVTALATHTAKDQSGPAAPGYGANDNATIQEVSLFLAGRLTSGVGVFVQSTYAKIDKSFGLDNTDIRLAKEFTLGGQTGTLGLSINTNPTVQDAWNTTPAWGYPFISSDLALGVASAPLVAGGLSQQVVGFTPYVWLNDNIYLEAGGYTAMSASAMNHLGIGVGPKVSGWAPYGRIAWNKTLGDRNFELGAFGMTAKLEPDRVAGPTDDYTDLGLDASYQFLGSKEHVFGLNAAWVHESRKLNASVLSGAAGVTNGSLESLTVTGSYTWKGKYGLTANVFSTTGNTDTTLYAPAQDTGSRVGKPDTQGYMLQADWTPWGDAGSWRQPWANLRLGVQYTGYAKYNGASSDYDGFGRKASDNNTLMFFAWTAF